MLVFIDETGDHDLVKIDPQYPLFGLGALLIDEKEYARLDAKIRALKEEYFESADFILHSSELKRPTDKRSDPRNAVMLDATIRRRFYEAFDAQIISAFNFKLVACFIHKPTMVGTYKFPADPYYFSFENLLNRILRHGGEKNLIRAEKRGDRLDTELIAEYERLLKVGLRFYPADTLAKRTTLELVAKKDCVNGLQIIDLILASLARDFLGKTAKMVGNDPSPTLLKKKYACPSTVFP